MKISIELLAIDIFSPLDEAIHKGACDMPKNRSNDLIENAAFELPMEFKFNLTGVLLQGNEIPLTRKMLKRAIYEHHIDGFWAMVDIAGMKVLSNALKFNIDFGF